MTVYQIITQRILQRIKEMEEQGKTFYWVKPWSGGAPIPESYLTQKTYNGINRLILEPGEYITFKGIQQYKESHPDTDVHIKKGSHKLPVFFYNTMEKKDKEGNPILDEEGNPLKVFFMKYFQVFSIEDVEGIESRYPAVKVDHSANEVTNKIDAYVKAYAIAENLTVDYAKNGSSCFYRSSDHMVRVPEKEGFTSNYAYYSTLLHEIIHSTSKGLSRKLGSFFGSTSYSREKLVAQIGSQMLLSQFGLEGDNKQTDNDIAYIKGWAKYLSDNTREVATAASQAEKAAQYFILKAEEILTKSEEMSRKETA